MKNKQMAFEHFRTKVFHEKAKKNQTLKLTRLLSEECEARPGVVRCCMTRKLTDTVQVPCNALHFCESLHEFGGLISSYDQFCIILHVDEFGRLIASFSRAGGLQGPVALPSPAPDRDQPQCFGRPGVFPGQSVRGLLWHYPVLRRIEISHSVLGDLESFLGKVFEACVDRSEPCAIRDKSTLTDLALPDNQLGEKDVAAIVKAMRGRQTPLTIHLDGNDFGAETLTLALASKFCQAENAVVSSQL
eukprot:s1256_g11.t1